MKKVLIVDDACFMRTSIGMMLKRHGFDIVGEAGNGREGFEKFQELRPDIVTMDITMPEMSGLDALKLIREFDPQANVVMVSAMGQDLLVREAVLNGAKSFIVKPFKEEQVVQVIKKILAI